MRYHFTLQHIDGKTRSYYTDDDGAFYSVTRCGDTAACGVSSLTEMIDWAVASGHELLADAAARIQWPAPRPFRSAVAAH